MSSSALSRDQIDILRHVRAGMPPWSGDVRLESLHAELEFLLALHLLEPGGGNAYRLTELGARALATLG